MPNILMNRFYQHAPRMKTSPYFPFMIYKNQNHHLRYSSLSATVTNIFFVYFSPILTILYSFETSNVSVCQTFLLSFPSFLIHCCSNCAILYFDLMIFWNLISLILDEPSLFNIFVLVLSWLSNEATFPMAFERRFVLRYLFAIMVIPLTHQSWQQ